MDLRQYLSSGILVRYVEGSLSDEKKQEVEKDAAQNPEIREEIERLMSEYLSPEEAKARLAALNTQPEEEKPEEETQPDQEKEETAPEAETEKTETPEPEPTPVAEVTAKPEPAPKKPTPPAPKADPSPLQKKMDKENQVKEGIYISEKQKKIYIGVGALAAIFIIMAFSFNYVAMKKYQDEQTKVAELEDELNDAEADKDDVLDSKADLEEEVEELELRITDLELEVQNFTLEQNKIQEIFSDADNKLVPMSGRDGEDASALIIWNSYTGETHLMVGELPYKPSYKQFQLWAYPTNSRSPVNLGVLDKDHESGVPNRMYTINNPQTFFITSEWEGGADTPSMSSKVAEGKVR